MDIRDDKWNAKLNVTGYADSFYFNGNLTQILNRVLLKLKDLRLRQARSGDTEMTLKISTGQLEFASKEMEGLMQMLPTDLLQREPFPSESFEEYRNYLNEFLEGNESVADMVAREFFNLPPDPQFSAWLNDPQAQRFVRLNSSNREFDKALPGEYESLKAYVMTHYPERCAQITFKTAT